MTTESKQRITNHGPLNRLLLAAVDILTGVTEASVLTTQSYQGTRHTFKVRKESDIQDD